MHLAYRVSAKWLGNEVRVQHVTFVLPPSVQRSSRVIRLSIKLQSVSTLQPYFLLVCLFFSLLLTNVHPSQHATVCSDSRLILDLVRATTASRQAAAMLWG